MNTKHLTRQLSIALFAMVFSGSAMAADAVEGELEKYYKAVEKSEQAYQEGLEKERRKAVTSILSSIKREGAKAEPGVIDDLWKLVLELEPENAEAKDYFTKSGKLASVTAALEKKKKNAPLIGDGKVTVVAVKNTTPRIDMSGAKAIRISSAFSSGYTLGSFKAGTVLIFQYVSGKWSGDNPDAKDELNQNPDLPESTADNRVQIFIDSGNEEKVLTVIGAGTAEKPFMYTVEEDVIGLSLRIANRKGIRNAGGRNRGGAAGGGNGLDQISSYTGEVKYLFRAVR